MSLLLIRFFSPVDVLGFGISIFLSENGALENVSFSALFIDFTRERSARGCKSDTKYRISNEKFAKI